jgi:hypothetical protein
MYRIMVFVKNTPANFMVQYKDEGIAKAEMENIKNQRKKWLETGKDSITAITGDDYGCIEFLTSEIVATALMFSADGVQLIQGQMGQMGRA